MSIEQTHPSLIMAEAMGIYCVSPIDQPTTMTRQGAPSHAQPIDYVLANAQAKDLVAASRGNYASTLSDHYPIEARIMTQMPHFIEIRWPQKN